MQKLRFRRYVLWVGDQDFDWRWVKILILSWWHPKFLNFEQPRFSETYSHLEANTIPKQRDAINDISVNEQMNIIGAAYEDHYVRLFDINSNKLISSQVAHQDACTAISISNHALNFATGSASNCIRVWSLDSKKCVQEISSPHLVRLDESICAVKFHPKMNSVLASCGADAIVKMYVQSNV